MEPFLCRSTELSHLFSLLSSLVSRLARIQNSAVPLPRPPKISWQRYRYHLSIVRGKSSMWSKTEFLQRSQPALSQESKFLHKKWKSSISSLDSYEPSTSNKTPCVGYLLLSVGQVPSQIVHSVLRCLEGNG